MSCNEKRMDGREPVDDGEAERYVEIWRDRYTRKGIECEHQHDIAVALYKMIKAVKDGRMDAATADDLALLLMRRDAE